MLAYKIIGVLSALLVSGSFIGFSQSRIDELKGEVLENELLYIPSEALLDHFTAGMSNVIADLLWIETIQYTVKEYHNPERKFKWLDHMCNAVVSLDPYFEGAYTNGAVFMSSIGSDESAMALLKKGFVNNPDSWAIPHEMVKVYILNRREEAGSPAAAAWYLRMLAERHQYPEMYLSWARRIQEENNLDQDAKAIWLDIIENGTDKFIVELAEQNLRILYARDNVAALEDWVEHFEEETGRRPQSLNELVSAGLLVAIPEGDGLGEYFLDEAGTVQCTLLQKNEKQRMLMWLNTQGRLVAQDMGRTASSMDEWVVWFKGIGFEDGLPEHPVRGGEWAFDGKTGDLF